MRLRWFLEGICTRWFLGNVKSVASERILISFDSPNHAIMRLLALFSLIVIICNSAYSQSLGVELSTGGFSFVPDFTSEEPHLILTASTNTQKRLQAHFLSLVRTENLLPRNAIFISRYQVSKGRLNASIGTHLPAIQISDDYEVDSFFAQEVLADYQINSHWTLKSMFLHGKGRNNDLEIHFGYIGLDYALQKWHSFTQIWAIDLNNGYGISQSIGYVIAPKTELRGFVNKTLSTGNTNLTIGIFRAF